MRSYRASVDRGSVNVQRGGVSGEPGAPSDQFCRLLVFLYKAAAPPRRGRVLLPPSMAEEVPGIDRVILPRAVGRRKAYSSTASPPFLSPHLKRS